MVAKLPAPKDTRSDKAKVIVSTIRVLTKTSRFL